MVSVSRSAVGGTLWHAARGLARRMAPLAPSRPEGWGGHPSRRARLRALAHDPLPGGLHTAVHDVTADEFFSIFEEACLELRREPRGIFARALPPAASGYGGGTRAGEARHHPGRFCARIAPAGTHEQR